MNRFNACCVFHTHSDTGAQALFVEIYIPDDFLFIEESKPVSLGCNKRCISVFFDMRVFVCACHILILCAALRVQVE